MPLPKDFGSFTVKVERILGYRKLSAREYAAKVKREAEQRQQLGQNTFSNPTAVDENTYSKDGITSAIEYDNPFYLVNHLADTPLDL